MRNKLDKIFYLDREFISYTYESETGTTPDAVFTRTESLNAGMKIPVFSAGAKSTESKSYSVSSYQMFAKLKKQLSLYPTFEETSFSYEDASVICKVNGFLSPTSVKVTRKTHRVTLVGKPKDEKEPSEKIISEEGYWKLTTDSSAKFALITSKEYFSSGVDQFPTLVGSVIDHLVFPVETLIRVFSAKSSFDEWIAVPFIITEKNNKF